MTFLKIAQTILLAALCVLVYLVYDGGAHNNPKARESRFELHKLNDSAALLFDKSNGGVSLISPYFGYILPIEVSEISLARWKKGERPVKLTPVEGNPFEDLIPKDGKEKPTADEFFGPEDKGKKK